MIDVSLSAFALSHFLFVSSFQMGSANINDRSQKGGGDSVIALVVEDNGLIHSTMEAMLEPRRLNNQAISSKAVKTSALALS